MGRESLWHIFEYQEHKVLGRCWVNKGERRVVVSTPFIGNHKFWIVWVPDLDRVIRFSEANAEIRAFIIANGYANSHD